MGPNRTVDGLVSEFRGKLLWLGHIIALTIKVDPNVKTIFLLVGGAYIGFYVCATRLCDRRSLFVNRFRRS